MEERRIPHPDKVSSAIREVLSKRGRVESQDELSSMVLRILRKEDSAFTVSPTRV